MSTGKIRGYNPIASEKPVADELLAQEKTALVKLIREKLGSAAAFALSDLKDAVKTLPEAQRDVFSWLFYGRNMMTVPTRIAAADYIAVYNPDALNGLFMTHGRRQVVYAKKSMTPTKRLAEARRFVFETRAPRVA